MDFKRLLIVLITTLCVATLAFGDAVISEFHGKVEVRSPGGIWRPAATGLKIKPNDTISTGFNASAVLSLGSNNVIVSPLTRMTLDAFLEKEKAVTTNLFLQVGAVRAQVDNSGKKQQKFNITSPYSTASVRGTEFTFDGLNLQVLRGTVALFFGPPVRVTQQQVAQPSQGGGDSGTADSSGESGDSGSGNSGGNTTGGRTPGGLVLVDAGETAQVDVDFTSGGTATVNTGNRSGFVTDPSSNGAGGERNSGSDDGSGSSTDDGGGSGIINTRPSVTTGSAAITWQWED